MLVDIVVDGGLVARVHPLELQAHAHAGVAPGYPAQGLDVEGRPRQPEPGVDLAGGAQRVHGPHREPPGADVQGHRGGDGLVDAVGDRNGEDDARAAAAVEAVGKQVGRQRRQDVLRVAVLVHVAGDAERGQGPHLGGAVDRSAEEDDRKPGRARPYLTKEGVVVAVGQPEIEEQEVYRIVRVAEPIQEHRGAGRPERAMTGLVQGIGESSADSVVAGGEEHGARTGSRHGHGRHRTAAARGERVAPLECGGASCHGGLPNPPD